MQASEEARERIYYDTCVRRDIDRIPILYPESLHDLVRFVRDVELKDHPKWSKMPGAWNPIYEHSPEKTILQLYTAFSQTFHELQVKGVESPRFMDAGGGNGIIARLANLVGYDAYSVESDTRMRDQSYHYNLQLNRLGIGSPLRSHLIGGSYYTPEYFRQARDQFCAYYGLKTEPSHGQMSDLEFILGLKQPTKEAAIAALQQMENGVGALEKHNRVTLLRTLKFDLIYTYPSDPLFRFGFFAQMGDMLQPGSRIIATSFNSHIKRAIRDNQPVDYGLYPKTAYIAGSIPMLIEFEKQPAEDELTY